MKFEFVGWQDTGNVDLKLTPESPEDKALLAALKSRNPRWSTGTYGEVVEILFPAAPPEGR